MALKASAKGTLVGLVVALLLLAPAAMAGGGGEASSCFGDDVVGGCLEPWPQGHVSVPADTRSFLPCTPPPGLEEDCVYVATDVSASAYEDLTPIRAGPKHLAHCLAGAHPLLCTQAF